MRNKKYYLNREDSNGSYKHNAKLLLKMYRKVNFHVNDRIQLKNEELYESKRKNLQDLVISFLEVDNSVNVQKLEDSLIDINISLSLLELMDLALERLSRYPNDGQLLSDILWHRYFSEESKTCEQLMDAHNMSRSSYFRYLNKATVAYGNMLFGFTLPDIIEVLQTLQELPMIADITNPDENKWDFFDTKLRAYWNYVATVMGLHLD